MVNFRKSISFLGLIILFIFGVFGGGLFRQYKNAHSVTIRVSSKQENLDYNLKSSLNFLKHQFELNGYYVNDILYPGGFYNLPSDDAAVHVFFRAHDIFWDARMNKNAVNVFYLPRFINNYMEEMRNYDVVLSSQNNLKNALGLTDKFVFLRSGGMIHELLKPRYQFDVLYIYEQKNDAYELYLRQNFIYKSFSNEAMGKKSEKQIKELLGAAKVVVYEKDSSLLNDEDYVPFAVYDIVGYGRPVITNYNSLYPKKFGQTIALFKDINEMMFETEKNLKLSDDAREEKGKKAREISRKFQDDEPQQIFKTNIKH